MKIIILRVSLLLFCSAMFVYPGFTQPNWKLSKDEDGIKVFESANDNGDFKTIKVESTLQGTMEGLVQILTDVAHHKDWIYNNKEASLLRRVSPDEIYYYSQTYLPWPMSNRDAVAHLKIIRDTINHSMELIEVGEPNYIPEKRGVVRVPEFSVNWHVTLLTPNKLNIVYVLKVDPGGSVPVWLSNMFIDKGPYETFKRLRELLK
jgi:hypothetical protein